MLHSWIFEEIEIESAIKKMNVMSLVVA